jgi:hypothetical protein
MKALLSFVFLCFTLQINSQCLQSKNKFSNSLVSNTGTNLSVTTENTIKSEFSMLKSFFNVNIDLAIIDYEKGPCYIPDLKTLVADKILFNNVSKLSFGNERIKAILAHEFAHALQDKAGLINLWTGGKKVELHADYLAGFYIGQKGLISKEKLKTFAQEFFDRGDFDFFDEDHHGTPEERRCAFLEGYKVAVKYNFNLTQAYNCGVDYIKLLYPCDAFGIIREYSKTEYNNNNYTLPTGNYIFKSSQKFIGFYNLYLQPLGYAHPGKDLVLSNLTPGVYVVVPGKVKISGRIKYYKPFSFTVKPNHTGGFTINKVGLFAIRTYSITF